MTNEEEVRKVREGSAYIDHYMQEMGGRFAQEGAATVVGKSELPTYPAASSTWQIQLPDEPPLGLDNPALDASISFSAGIDVRSTGGYAIWWPAAGLPFEDFPLAEWPEWLLKEARGVRRQRTTPLGPCKSAALHRVHGHTLNPRKRIKALQRKVEYAQPGNRNAMLNWAAFQMGLMVVEGLLKRQVAEAVLCSAAHSNGLWREDGREQCRATIRSGLEAGIKAAHGIEALEHGPYGVARSELRE